MNIVTNLNKININTKLYDEVFFSDETDLKKLVKIANKQKINKIYFVSKNDECVLVKIKNIWKIVDKFSLNLFVIRSENLMFDINKKYFENIKYSSEYNASFEKGDFIFDDSINVLELKLNLIINENFWNNICSEGNYFYKHEYIKNDEKVKNFKDKISKSKKIDGIGGVTINENENFYEIKAKEGWVKIIENDSNYTMISFSKKSSKVDSISYANGLITNIKNNINQVMTSKPTMKSKNLIMSAIAFVFVMLLLWITFSKIFGSGGIEGSFRILFDSFTWTQIWVYILFFNFLVTFFISFILAYFIDVVIGGKKYNFKRVFNYFISIHIKNITLFLTGNLDLALFIWGYYLNSTAKIKTSTLVATIGVANIFKTIGLLINGIIYMLPATFYLAGSFENSLQSWSVFVLSYGGMFYSIAQDFMIGAIIFLPTLHPLYVRIRTSFTYKNNGNYFNSLQKANSDLESLNNSMRKMIKSKERIFRTIFMTLIIVFMEAIETITIFQMVENYGNHYYGQISTLFSEKGHAHYYNLFAISGCRMMSTFIRHFPLLNIIPGQGVGITDYFMKNINEVIIMKEHSIGINELDIYRSQINSIAINVTFITRLFNFYLTKTLSLFLTIFALLKIIYTKYTKNKERYNA